MSPLFSSILIVFGITVLKTIREKRKKLTNEED